MGDFAKKLVAEKPEFANFVEVELTHPGRVFLTVIHETKKPCCPLLPSLNYLKNKKIVVLPVDGKQTFKEILATQRMWLDHFPNCYEKILQNLKPTTRPKCLPAPCQAEARYCSDLPNKNDSRDLELVVTESPKVVP